MDSQFKEAVFTIVRLIPKGRVSTYGAIAKAIGFPNHARYVGNVLGGCPSNVPAHRVVASNGILRVISFQKKLETEGIVVTKMKIKNFKKLFWNPMLEL